MKRTKHLERRIGNPLVLLVVIFLATAMPHGIAGQQSTGIASLTGDWTGESICVDKVKFPACNDEKVIYRITPTPNTANTVTITMDKLVDGKPENMAVLDFKYDEKKGTLRNEFTRNGRQGVWEFTVNGNAIEGTLVALPDNTIVRRIKVSKNRS